MHCPEWRKVTLLLFCGVCASAFQQPAAQPSAEAGRISVNVNLVVLHATVAGKRGHFVSDLRQDDFQVYEDGVPQQIVRFGHEDAPITAGIIVDHSGSMLPKIPEISAAVRTFATASNPSDEMFVVDFNERVRFGLPASIPFTDNPSLIQKAVAQSPVGGETALYDAIVAALAKLKAGTRDKKVLIVISDGGDNASVRTRAQTLKLAQASSAIIYTVGIFDEDDPDRNPGVLRDLARSTGGIAYFPSGLNEISSICSSIARDVRNQYMLAYVPSDPAAHGDYRSIRVTVNAPHHGKLVARTRNGYRIGRPAERCEGCRPETN